MSDELKILKNMRPKVSLPQTTLQHLIRENYLQKRSKA